MRPFAAGAFALAVVALLTLVLYHRTQENLPKLQRADFATGETVVEDTGPPIFAIADLHGDLNKAHQTLQLAGVVKDKQWNGGRATLVQLGDIFDRGHESLKTFSLFAKLKDQARQVGGHVEMLLGNHEYMVLEGTDAYFSNLELNRLGTEYSKLHADMRGMTKVQRIQFGRELLKDYIKPDAEIGMDMRSLNLTAVLGQGKCRTVFVHAALPPGLLVERDLQNAGLQFSPEELLAQINSEAQEVTKCSGGHCGSVKPASTLLLANPESPIWSRAYVKNWETQLCADVKTVLKRLGAYQIVVGHNVMPHGKAVTKCDRTLFMIDVGMSAVYGDNSATVWKCHNGQTDVIYDRTKAM